MGFTTPVGRDGLCIRATAVDKRLNTLAFVIFDDGVYSEGSCTKELSVKVAQKEAVQKDSVQKDSTIYGDKHWTMIIK